MPEFMRGAYKRGSGKGTMGEKKGPSQAQHKGIPASASGKGGGSKGSTVKSNPRSKGGPRSK